MISVIRRYFKNGSQVVLWIVIAAFVIGLMPLAFRQASQTAIWAIKVNGQEIGYQEFLLERERQRDHIIAFRQQYGEYADMLLTYMGANDPQTLAVRDLIRQELLNQFADSLGVYVNNAYIEQKMKDISFIQQELPSVIPPHLVNPITGIDQKMLGRYLKHFGISVESFERQIERALIEKLATEMVASTMYVPSFDIRNYAMTQLAKKSFSVITIPLSSFVKEEQKKEVAADLLHSFYTERNAKTNQYTVPQKRTGMLWTFDPKAYDAVIADVAVKEYYENNKNKKYVESPAMIEIRRIVIAIPNSTQRAAMQEKAAHIKDELLNDPTKFAEVAKRISDDKESAVRGGLLKPFARGSQEAAIDRAAFLLQKDGDISDVIETKNGLEILQRVSKAAQKFKSFDSVKSAIKHMLAMQAFQKQFTADMRGATDDEASFTALVQAKGAVAKELKGITQDESVIAQHLFKLAKGQRAFFIDGDKGMVVRLDGIHESYVPSLDSIRQTVLHDYHEQQAQRTLKDALSKARQVLATKSMQEVSKSFPGELTQTGLVASDDQALSESLKKKGLPLDKMLQIEKAGGVIVESDGRQGFIIRLDEIQPIESTKFAEKQGEISRAFQQERLQQYLAGFVASLYRNATIETNESVITLQI